MSSSHRESMDADVVVIGGGVAGLSMAIHFQKLVLKHNEQNNQKLEPTILVLEKGSQIGAHSFSGAVLNPCALKEFLEPQEISEALSACLATPVEKEAVYYLGTHYKIKFPFLPPPLKNKGYHIISLSLLNKWLGQKAEELGIHILPGFAATEVLYEDNKVVGVRTGDRGRDKKGLEKSNFEMGMDLKAKITIFAEGPRGSLFRKLASHLQLREGKAPDTYSEGVKEIIQMPKGSTPAGQVIHTLGYPLRESVGGTFIYTLKEDRIVIGLVGYLGTQDPLFDPHRELQKLKKHPFIYQMIKGGEVIEYGGRVIPAGGWSSMPKLYHDGMMVVGDSGGMVDDQKLKGIHLAMKSGVLSAQTAFESLINNDFSKNSLKLYEDRVMKSYIQKELYRVRHFHHTLNKGLFLSAPLLLLQHLMKGHALIKSLVKKDFKTTAPILDIWGVEKEKHIENQLPPPDGKLFFDKLSSVYLTGTAHEEDSPNHLLLQDGRICQDVCYEKFNSPCHFFCPANVYEMLPEEKTNHLGQKITKKKLKINYTNCIHCKACDIKCPFDNILWTSPEGGGGPNYQNT